MSEYQNNKYSESNFDPYNCGNEQWESDELTEDEWFEEMEKRREQW